MKKTVRVTTWRGTTRVTEEVHSYRTAMEVVDSHQNARAPAFEEIETGRRLVDDGVGLRDGESGVYVLLARRS